MFHASLKLRVPAFLGLLLGLLLTGCRTTPPPPANLSAPGWQIQSGEALWKPTATKPELAGEILFATNQNGNLFVQFTKSPFTLVTAQIADGAWHINFGDEYVWGGQGNPPNRFTWFQLPRALTGETLPKQWSFTRPTADSWRLENRRTGETLEGSFAP